MATSSSPKPRVFVDADVLFAGAASPSKHAASAVFLRMAEITLIEAITSDQVIAEVERNLGAKMPAALPLFRLLVSRCLDVVPSPTVDVRLAYVGLADPKDLSLLVVALRGKCSWLVTFNGRHFQPGHPAVKVLPPGALLQRVRHLPARLQ